MRRLLALILVAQTLTGCAPVIVAGGVAGGALMVSDRRTSGAYVEDQSIETKAANRLTARFGDKIHVNVTSFNRQILLTGEVPDAATKTEIEQLAKQVENIKAVFNETRIAPLSSLANRSQDTWITSQAKTQMLSSKEFSASHIKVLTENSIIYLMGLVARKEGEAAARIAAQVPQTQKVVTLFEYTDG